MGQEASRNSPTLKNIELMDDLHKKVVSKLVMPDWRDPLKRLKICFLVHLLLFTWRNRKLVD